MPTLFAHAKRLHGKEDQQDNERDIEKRKDTSIKTGPRKTDSPSFQLTPLAVGKLGTSTAGKNERAGAKDTAERGARRQPTVSYRLKLTFDLKAGNVARA